MRAYLTLAFILCVGLPLHAAEIEIVPPAPVVVESEANRLLRRTLSRYAFSRSVRDLATWDFAALTKNPNWVIAQIISAAPAYTRYVPLPPEEREGLAPDDPNYPAAPYFVTSYVGTVNMLTPLVATPEMSHWFYHYEKKGLDLEDAPATPFMLRGNPFGSEAREEFSPFRHQPVEGATRNLVLVSPPESIQNVEARGNAAKAKYPEFRPYYISEENLKWVVPALTFYKANPDLFSSEKVAANHQPLLELLDNENPFLFATAVRTLAKTGELDSSYISDKLLKADRFRQAVFVYSVLYYSPQKQGEILVEVMQQTIGAAQNKTQLEGLIIGTNRASQSSDEFALVAIDTSVITHGLPRIKDPSLPTPPPSLQLFLPLMAALNPKQHRFAITTEKDEYLASLITRIVAVPAAATMPQ